VGEPSEPALQALVRWDPAGFADRETTERQSAHLPPASRLATVSGPEEEVEQSVAMLDLPPGAEVLGPAPVPPLPGERRDADEPPQVRVVVRVPRAVGDALSRTLVEMQGVRDAKKLGAVRVQVDPFELG
jgi:primosomal protein N' (replication factor Y)